LAGRSPAAPRSRGIASFAAVGVGFEGREADEEDAAAGDFDAALAAPPVLEEVEEGGLREEEPFLGAVSLWEPLGLGTVCGAGPVGFTLSSGLFCTLASSCSFTTCPNKVQGVVLGLRN